MTTASPLARAGRWLLESGIQQASGGVARYYISDSGTAKPVSTEITGYAASAFTWLFRITAEERYLGAARRAAEFLMFHAWNPQLKTFPVELPPKFVYFFDCGIIVRGLIAFWRITREDQLIEIASEACHGMIRDFRFRPGPCYHPILSLPDKFPALRENRWSHQPGCYQLKAALAWHEVAEITGDRELRAAFEEALATAIATSHDFLPGSRDRQTIMDRLHAYCYFLEGLAKFTDRKPCGAAYSEGVDRVAALLREIAPEFVRSDVYGQLLRARLLAHRIMPVDRDAAAHEAGELAAFQISSDDPRSDGGWSFGRRNGELSPHINPASTAFAIQALELWRSFQAGNTASCEPLV